MALMWAPNGDAVQVPDENVTKALSIGYTKRDAQTQREIDREAGEHPLQAFGEGAAMAIPGGGFLLKHGEAIATGENPDDVARRIKARKEANPIAHGAGTVTGIVAPMLLTGGGSLAAVAGRGLAGAAVEGGVYGLNDAANDAMLDNVDLTAEKAAAGIAGGVFGGALFHGAGKLVGKVASKIVSPLDNQVLADVVENVAQRAESKVGTEVEKLPFLGTVGKKAAEGAMAGLGVGDPFHGAVGGALYGLKQVAFNRILEKPLQTVQARGLRAVANAAGEEGLGTALASRVNKVLDNAPTLFGSARQGLELAAAKGSQALLAEHEKQASGPNGEQYMATLGLGPDGPNAQRGLEKRLDQLSLLQALQGAYDTSANTAQKSLLGSKPGKTSGFSAVSAKSFDAKSAQINNILQNPGDIYAHLPDAMRATFPQASMQLASTIVNGAKFLDSKMPKDPSGGLKPEALAPAWKPSVVEVDKWLRYHEAVMNPTKAMENLSKGMIVPEYVESLKAVYPKAYSDFQQNLAVQLMQHKGTIPYSKQLALRAILGSTVTGMTNPQSAIIQSIHAENMQGAPAKGPDGRQNVSQEENLQTQAQRIEGR